MSDELDKLAAEMKKITPTSPARKRGMDAAMAAFNAEFDTASASEKSKNFQGSETDARPTAQTTKSSIMSKLNNILSFEPRTKVMMGSFAAALLASVFILPPAMDRAFEPGLDDNFSEIASEVEATEAYSAENEPSYDAAPTPERQQDEIIVTSRRTSETEAKANDAEEGRVALSDGAEVADAPQTQQDIASPPTAMAESKPATNDTVSAGRTAQIESEADSFLFRGNQGYGSHTDAASTNTETRQREAEFRAKREQQTSRLFAPNPSRQEGRIALEARAEELRKMAADPNVDREQLIREYRAILQQKDNIALFVDELDLIEAQMQAGSRDKFDSLEPNPLTAVKDTPVSTFSIDVDTASYSFLRASLNRGQIPSPDTIRVEELINYFPYDYAAPTSPEEPFSANVTVAPTPWNTDTKLMHIGIKGYVPPASERPSSNIVFLIDTSGSMNQPNKLPLLINSFKLMLGTLNENDTVSIVTYAGSAGTVLEPTPASQTGTIKGALNKLQAGGSTAGAAGLELAYQKAQESFIKDGVNRVILATDGDFNVGFSTTEDMTTFIENKRETGIFLSVLGFGSGNYNDALMQTLAQNGNGVAAYIDNLSEANKVLADAAGGALFTIAKDVKIQVEFNPDTVAEYRLIGYESRALRREDFNNDAVDAGEIGAGHSVTAIYELTPVGSPAQMIDDLRYAAESAASTTGSDELAFVKIRHKLPDAQTSTLQTFPVGPTLERGLDRASDDMRFATAVAAVGQKLRGDVYLKGYSYSDAIDLANSAKGDDPEGYRAEFVQLARLIDSLQD